MRMPSGVKQRGGRVGGGVATTQPVHVCRAGLCCAVCVCACRPLITLALAVDAGIGPVQVGVAAVAPFCAACLTGISLGNACSCHEILRAQRRVQERCFRSFACSKAQLLAWAYSGAAAINLLLAMASGGEWSCDASEQSRCSSSAMA
eukprot:SAG25_NODE_2976_length_1285_cov_1.468803_1_plen_148_part_00